MINQNDSVLFIGLGGAGQRHLRILRKILPKNNFYALRKRNASPLLKPNFQVDNSSTIEDKYRVESFYNEDLLKNKKPKITIISSPTISHTKYCLFAKELGSHVFVEKPAIAKISDLNLLEKNFRNSKLSLKVGFQRFFHPMIKKVLEEINKDSIKENYECFLKLSSFIPDWHPYEDFRNLYACQKDLGGGVILTECHEIDILNNIFGTPLNIKKDLYSNKKYKLDVYDSAKLKVNYERCTLFADISFMRQPNERSILIKNIRGDIEYLIDLNQNKLSLKKNNEEINLNYEFDNDYLFELQAKNLILLENKNDYELNRLKNLCKFI